MARYQGGLVAGVAGFYGPPWPAPGRPARSSFTPAQTSSTSCRRSNGRSLGLAPSPMCSDAEFIRRASLDLTGTLPQGRREGPRTFVAGAGTRRRSGHRAHRPLAGGVPNTPIYFAVRSGATSSATRRRRTTRPSRRGTYRLARLAQGPDRRQTCRTTQLARAFLTATGNARPDAPPSSGIARLRGPPTPSSTTPPPWSSSACVYNAPNATITPFEVWSAGRFYYGFAAFFGRVGRKLPPGASQSNGQVPRRRGNLRGPRRDRPRRPKDRPRRLTPRAPRRPPRCPRHPRRTRARKLAKWLHRSGEPLSSPGAVANRYLGPLFFGPRA